MKGYVAAGLTVIAGVALLEVAIVPGIVIGGAAVLAPAYLPKLRRRVEPALKSFVRRQAKPAASRPRTNGAAEPAAAVGKLDIKQAIAKTITFRIIVTTLDFTMNYVVIGEVTTAAGLSTFNLIAGPLFYLGHETAWNYLGPSESAADFRVPLPSFGRQTPHGVPPGFTINRALAKTITFRGIATVMDFATNYVVVRDVAMAALLSASGFVLGPFVYLGHEMAWDYYTSPNRNAAAPPLMKRLLGPA
jgi:uncharacterized membrane protein